MLVKKMDRISPGLARSMQLEIGIIYRILNTNANWKAELEMLRKSKSKNDMYVSVIVLEIATCI